MDLIGAGFVLFFLGGRLMHVYWTSKKDEQVGLHRSPVPGECPGCGGELPCVRDAAGGEVPPAGRHRRERAPLHARA